MTIKYATNRVAGWNQRHINTTKVVKRLYSRLARGYILYSDEVEFLRDVASLTHIYN